MSTRRAALAALLAALALLLPACEKGKPTDKLEGPSAAKIADNWSKVTGETLVRETDLRDFAMLQLPEGGDRYETYGIFSISVAKTRRGRTILLQDPATEKIPKREGGVRWQAARDGKSWAALKTYGENIVVRWQAGEQRELTPAFRRLDQTVKAVIEGDPGELPAAERPCERAGIDPETGTKEGECRLDDVALTIVNAGSRLEPPELAAELKAVQTSPAIPPASEYGEAERAKGRFVVATYELENRGRQPIESLRLELGSGGRTYAEATSTDYNLERAAGERDPFPLQPGDKVTLSTAFDVPAPAATAAAARGVLVFPAGRYEEGSGSLTEEVAQGRIRLEGAPSSDPAAPDLRLSARERSRERAQAEVERTVRRFFASVRRRDAPALCALLTRREVLARGGLPACRRSARVKDAAARLVPPRSAKARLTVFVLAGGARASVVASGSSFSGAYVLVRERGRWRVAGFRRTR